MCAAEPPTDVGTPVESEQRLIDFTRQQGLVNDEMSGETQTFVSLGETSVDAARPKWELQ